MTYLIILNGTKPREDLLIKLHKTADVILCADGGGRYVHDMGMHIDILMGDMDSIDGMTLEAIRAEGARIITHSKHKDETDAQLALDYAMEHGATRITIMGGEGGRSDHFYANLMLLRRMAQHGIETSMITDGGEVRCCHGMVTIEGSAGDTVSVLPISDDMVVASTQGLEYPINEPMDMPMDTPLGISNKMIEDTAQIKITSGWALVFHYNEGGIL